VPGTLPSAPLVPSGEEADKLNEESRNGLAHEIGLVSVSAGTDPKYVGPSSGYSFAKLLLAHTGRRTRGSVQRQPDADATSPSSLPMEMFLVTSTPLPSSLDHTLQLSATYFEFIHVQFPFLHQPSHRQLIEHVYKSENPSPIASFQVGMVLAISATILSRRVKLPFSGEGFAATAITFLEQLDIEHSLQGLQCLLLLTMYTLHSSFLGFNAWYLNYQAIAAVLDLGLQRDVRAGRSMTFLEQEMRTRVFWVVYTLDRTLATTMGRPIGLRDEACDLRVRQTHVHVDLKLIADHFYQLPMDISDDLLSNSPTSERISGDTPTSITCAIHLFKLAQYNSEIKYILHSISRDTPRYTYPSIPDISEWQKDMMVRLRQWWVDIPQFYKDKRHMTLMCELKYHEIIMLLLRPSPRIHNPTEESMTTCHASAVTSTHIWKELYQAERLTYSWTTIHAISLSVTTMLYCIWTVPNIAKGTKVDALISDVRAGSNVLSAAGEHWSEAKKSRNILDELSNATIRWLMDVDAQRTNIQAAATRAHQSTNSVSETNSPYQPLPTPADSLAQLQPLHTFSDPGFQQQYSSRTQGDFNHWPFANVDTGIESYISSEDLAAYLGAPDPYSSDIHMTMQGIFSEFQPTFDFGSTEDMGMRFQ
jgi:hypothetical protein